TVVSVDHPVPAAVLHDLDRRQDRQLVLSPIQACPAARPVLVAEGFERQEVPAALVAATDGRTGDLVDWDRAKADLDRTCQAGIRMDVVEEQQRVPASSSDLSDTHPGALADRTLDALHRIADAVYERFRRSSARRPRVAGRPGAPPQTRGARRRGSVSTLTWVAA